jgi:2-amino-4-hydroxy-6-hydroxymethyldihydropteridine diphosphokinase
MIDTPELQVPHPRMHLRRFVLVPLAEIAPRIRHPRTHLTPKQMMARAGDKSQVRAFVGRTGEENGRR